MTTVRLISYRKRERNQCWKAQECSHQHGCGQSQSIPGISQASYTRDMSSTGLGGTLFCVAMAEIATEGRKNGQKSDHEGPCAASGEHL